MNEQRIDMAKELTEQEMFLAVNALRYVHGLAFLYGAFPKDFVLRIGDTIECGSPTKWEINLEMYNAIYDCLTIAIADYPVANANELTDRRRDDYTRLRNKLKKNWRTYWREQWKDLDTKMYS